MTLCSRVLRAFGALKGLFDVLMQAGLDSLGAVELRNAIGAEFSTDLPATAIFDYPTLFALADHLTTISSTGVVTCVLFM